MGKIRITQIRSAINRLEKQKRTIRALGIRRLHHTVEHEETPQIRGMIRVVAHLVRVEQVAR
ncbi:MAG: 50S ribosomal protein L30 [Candidatus Eisenbacteria sp.]|nr:50S ribosomal protein L30 [Candidatus Eisenbacteria bacterium]